MEWRRFDLYLNGDPWAAARLRRCARRINFGAGDLDPMDRLEIPARILDEARYQVIGRIGENTWSAFITYRNENIRIISVRRARSDEEARYLAGQGVER